jgi:CheY-like chemotaxis protein
MTPSIASAIVVDDNRQMADSLCQMLSLLDVAAQPAYGPRAAMLLVSETKPDILFLDITMPGLDGFEVLAYFRRLPQLVDVPVVVVTSDDQPETTQKALQSGAIQVIIKPVTFSTLEEVLRKTDFITS